MLGKHHLFSAGRSTCANRFALLLLSLVLLVLVFSSPAMAANYLYKIRATCDGVNLSATLFEIGGNHNFDSINCWPNPIDPERIVISFNRVYEEDILLNYRGLHPECHWQDQEIVQVGRAKWLKCEFTEDGIKRRATLWLKKLQKVD